MKILNFWGNLKFFNFMKFIKKKWKFEILNFFWKILKCYETLENFEILIFFLQCFIHFIIYLNRRVYRVGVR